MFITISPEDREAIRKEIVADIQDLDPNETAHIGLIRLQSTSFLKAILRGESYSLLDQLVDAISKQNRMVRICLIVSSSMWALVVILTLLLFAR